MSLYTERFNIIKILDLIEKRIPLAHPNIRLYIYQGGLYSTDEAIGNAVPLIGLPVSIDQSFNAKRMQNYRVGKVLSITDLNEKEFREAILEVITNSR